MEENKLKEEINPDDIVMDMEEAEDDSEMPTPETKVYKNYLKVTDKFKSIFSGIIGSLPYNTILTSPDNKQLRLLDFVKFVESRYEKISIDEMNIVIGYIANLDFNHARPLMEIVEDREQQAQLWSVIKDND